MKFAQFTCLFLSTLCFSSLLLDFVDCGCFQRRLCCTGRNMSCVSVEIGSRNVLNVDYAVRSKKPTDSSETTRHILRGGTNWHLHVPDMKLMDDERLDNFTQSLYTYLGADVEHASEFEHLKLPFLELDDLSEDHSSGFFKEGKDDDESQSEISGNYSSVTFLDFGNEPQEEDIEHEDRSSSDEQLQYHQVIPEDVKYVMFGDDPRMMKKPRPNPLEKVERNGNVKEIRYVIIDGVDSSKESKIGLLQSDKNLAKQCYCDEACRSLHDCCSDFLAACPSTDCEVSPWSSWGYCKSKESNSQCGPGISNRTRSVVRPPQLGGLRCPHLEEQRACYSLDSASCGKLASEVALLLPYKFSSAREPGYKSHIYYDLPKTLTKLASMTSYCSIFDVQWLNSNCRDADTRRQLAPGAKVCVECQPAVMKQDQDSRCTGHGLEQTKTIFSLINTKNCNGEWKLIEKVVNCQCVRSYSSNGNYIFV